MSDNGNGQMVVDAVHMTNGDEALYANRIGNFHKGLPHDNTGEVVPAAYDTLLAAVTSGALPDFEAIELGLGRKLTNPTAGLASDLEGPLPSDLVLEPPPALASDEEAAEAVELYWMALLRDVPFTKFDQEPLVAVAVNDINALSAVGKLYDGIAVTPQTLFRGFTSGDQTGPFISQFLLKDIVYGALTIPQTMKTVVPGLDYLTHFDEWLAIQNGYQPGPDQFDQTPRYIRNMRDMGQWVHMDALYEAYLNACLVLLAMKAPFDMGNPYNPASLGSSKTMFGFGTRGDPHILSLVTEVATRALKTVWFQKWFVHRRLRPEAYGGLVHVHQTGQRPYPLHADILQSAALERTFKECGTYLLPQAFPEGSPTHPAYGAGHATVAGACVTLLKAWFDETAPVPNPVVPDKDGTRLLPYMGDDAQQLTIGGELNKLAANIAIGRNMAGIHWRSDYRQSVKIGEQVALIVLFNQRQDYPEDYSFSLTGFDGSQYVITRDGITQDGAPYLP